MSQVYDVLHVTVQLNMSPGVDTDIVNSFCYIHEEVQINVLGQESHALCWSGY